jgi:hypothetical protein
MNTDFTKLHGEIKKSVFICDSTAKRLSHREACEDRQENAKSQIIIQDNLRHDSTFLKCS